MGAVPPEPTTLVGVATGRPDGGVAVVRLSGPDALSIAETMAGPLPTARRIVRRDLALDASGEAREQALVVCMPGPASYTGEDVVELHVHAGALNVEQVLGRAMTLGARAAGPGEFTRRAFENGCLSLDEAEGVAALIGARTRGALLQARRLVAGELGQEVERVRERVSDLLAEVEANLDFPEDVAGADVARWHEQLETDGESVARWLRRFEAGRRARTRARVVLAGPPNAGKSALFNALLGRPRAIVAQVPGTTRDYVEAEWEVGGFAAVLVDTAGLRESADVVERAGVELSREQIEGADVLVWTEAADEAPRPEAGTRLEGATVIQVETKRDLGMRRADWIGASIAGEPGTEQVARALLDWFRVGEEPAWIGLARHRDCAREGHEALREAQRELGDDGGRLELVAFSLGVAQRRLGAITGRHALGAVGEEVLERIFSRFCIGK